MTTKSPNKARTVYIVDGARTPFIKAGAKPNPLSAADLMVAAGRPLLMRQNFKPQDIDEVIVGCVMQNGQEANVARVIGLRLGLGHAVPAWTVARNCASGLQAIDSALQSIESGRSDLVLCGGTEAMSRAPLLYNDAYINWISDLRAAKTLPKKLLSLLKLRPQFFSPIIALLQGLSDPLANMSMGQTAEKMVHQFDLCRAELDAYSVQSHKRAHQAILKGMAEVETLIDTKGYAFDSDNGVREDSSVEKLAKLKPVFDKPFGTVTAGNSSQITDGAAALILASEDAVKKYKLKPMAVIRDIQWAGVDPSIMGIGPVHAIAKVLANNNLKLSEIDLFEINEAFAAQVLGCVKAFSSKKYCQEKLNLKEALGNIDPNKLNVEGGAIALGHPVGASGARIALHLCHLLKNRESKLGIASLCIGGGQGGAILLEKIASKDLA